MTRKNPSDDTGSNSFSQQKLNDYRKYGLTKNIVPLMRRRFGFNNPEFADGEYMKVLLQHMRFIRGERWVDLCGDPADLTESMSDFYQSEVPDEHQKLQGILWHLQDKGLVYKRRGHRGRVYWDVTKSVWELVEDQFTFDGGEGPAHRRAVGLVSTYFRALQRYDVELYATIPNKGKVDAVVYPTPPADAPNSITDLAGYGSVRDEVLKTRLEEIRMRAAKDHRVTSWPPGERPLAVEVMNDHHNTQLVLNRYDAIADSQYDGLWVFSDRETLNQWIRRLANPETSDENPRFQSPYRWSPTTPIDTAQERIKRMDLAGMHWVTTVDRLEKRINSVEDKHAKLRRAYSVRELAQHNSHSDGEITRTKY